MSSAISGERRALVAHPAQPAAPAVRTLTVAINRPSAELLTLDYRLEADLQELRIPDVREPVRADGLWRHTCFEAFIGQTEAPGYWEFNFSPSRAWAAYHFTAYREGMAPLMKGAPPVISTREHPDLLELSVAVDLSWLSRTTISPTVLGVSAVIEDRARAMSYWALRHPAEKPDFHHAEGFVVPLD
ncbi:MAG TPA: DOMON-like domain-containing protein [Steroidobacteraceae bacterium]|nr:DOMON-like domain-containing protein [Steroidobacteraceae bacterium]